jgi:hypothetical protein
VSPVKYELGFYIPEGDILHNHRRGNNKSYTIRAKYGKYKVSKNDLIEAWTMMVRLRRLEQGECGTGWGDDKCNKGP